MWKQLINSARPVRSIIRGKLILFPGSKPPPSEPLKYLSWSWFNYHLLWGINMSLLLYVCFPDGLSLPLLQGRRPQSGKKLLENVFPTWGMPFTISSEPGPPLHWMKSLAETLQTSWNYHCPYHTQLSDKVERTNGVLKLKISKFAKTIGLPWPHELPLALLTVCKSTSGNMNSPHMKQSWVSQCLVVYNLLLGVPFCLTLV